MVVKLLAEAAAPDTICKLIGLCSQNVEKGRSKKLELLITILIYRTYNGCQGLIVLH